MPTSGKARSRTSSTSIVWYCIWDLDFRGAIAHEKIDEAEKIGGGVASEIFGWYLEAGYHFWPEAWKKGKLEKADAIAFVRYDDFDTQHRMPSGVTGDPTGDRNEWTLGLGFYFTPNFVAKADYQMWDDSTGRDPSNLFNLGVGWQFYSGRTSSSSCWACLRQRDLPRLLLLAASALSASDLIQAGRRSGAAARPS